MSGFTESIVEEAALCYFGSVLDLLYSSRLNLATN